MPAHRDPAAITDIKIVPRKTEKPLAKAFIKIHDIWLEAGPVEFETKASGIYIQVDEFASSRERRAVEALIEKSPVYILGGGKYLLKKKEMN